MQYPLFTILELITILITLLVGMVAFHLLIKRWQKTIFLSAFRVIALYVIGATILSFLVNSLISENEITKSILSKILFIGSAFTLYYFLIKRNFDLSPKKTILSFFIIIVVALPILGFLRLTLMHQLSETPLLRGELERMQSYLWEQAGERGFDSNIYINSVPLVVLGEIEKATFNWPSEIIIIFLVPGKI
jgi:uncharacterized membrane protein